MLDMFGFYMNGIAIKDAYLEARAERSLPENNEDNQTSVDEDDWERYCDEFEELD